VLDPGTTNHVPYMTDPDTVPVCPSPISLRRLRSEYFEDRQPDAEQFIGALRSK